jgi:hypothetical protein
MVFTLVVCLFFGLIVPADGSPHLHQDGSTTVIEASITAGDDLSGFHSAEVRILAPHMDTECACAVQWGLGYVVAFDCWWYLIGILVHKKMNKKNCF